jgi:hypothetical protein
MKEQKSNIKTRDLRACSQESEKSEEINTGKQAVAGYSIWWSAVFDESYT